MDPDERAARRTVALIAAALVAVVIGVVVVSVTALIDRDQDGAQTIDQTDEVVAVGPPRGVDVSSYIGARRQLPADLGRSRVVVVSFGRYVAPEEADAIVPSTVDVLGRLVALRGGEGTFVTGPIDRWSTAARAEADEEYLAIEELLPTVEDPEFATFYRRELERLDLLRSDTRADVVYGIVGVADGVSLATLLSSPDVRLVDVAAGTRLAPSASIAGLRPEEVSLSGEPETRP